MFRPTGPSSGALKFAGAGMPSALLRSGKKQRKYKNTDRSSEEGTAVPPSFNASYCLCVCVNP
jgi:hypothetical protein